MTTIAHKGVRESDGQAVTLYETIQQVSDGRGGWLDGLRDMRDAKGHPYNFVSDKRFSHYDTKEVVRLLD